MKRFMSSVLVLLLCLVLMATAATAAAEETLPEEPVEEVSAATTDGDPVTPSGTIDSIYIKHSSYNPESDDDGNFVSVFVNLKNVCGTESLVLNLYSGDKVIATSSLVDDSKVLLKGENIGEISGQIITAGKDSWWNTSFPNGPLVAGVEPTSVELVVDGTVCANAAWSTVHMCDPAIYADTVTWSTIPGVKVAKIEDGDYYDTLQAAINAASANQTVTLLGDIEATGITVAADDDIIIDLGKNTVKGDFMVYGKATIQNGKIEGTRAGYSAIESNGASADLTVQDLTVSSLRHAIRADGGKLTVNSGTYSLISTKDVTQYVINASTKAQVTINGGAFTSVADEPAIGDYVIGSRDEGTLVTINGGTFTGGSGASVYESKGGDIQIPALVNGAVNTSVFDTDPTACIVNPTAGGTYFGLKGENDLYSIAAAMAQIGDKPYGSLASAVEAANAAASPATIQLLADVSENVEITKSVTLELGTYKLVSEITAGEAVELTVSGTNTESSITLPALTDKTGHTFGWNAGETKATKLASGRFQIVPENTAKTYKATWTINQYTITFDTAGGSAIAAITQDYDTAVTAPGNPTKTGYTFKEWDKAIPATMPAENLTITATWTAYTYTIAFDGNGGEGSMDSVTASYGTKTALPANGFELEGKVFAGWALNKQGDVIFADKAQVLNLSETDGDTVTLYAQWKDAEAEASEDTSGNTDIPSTGDSRPLGLMAALLALSSLGLGTVLILRKKRG